MLTRSAIINTKNLVSLAEALTSEKKMIINFFVKVTSGLLRHRIFGRLLAIQALLCAACTLRRTDIVNPEKGIF